MTGVCKSEHFDFTDLYVHMYIVIVMVPNKNYHSMTFISYLLYLYLSTLITEIQLFYMNFEQSL